MAEYHVYSDYSRSSIRGAYAYAVVRYDPLIVVRARSRQCAPVETITGEIMGFVAALKCLPNGATVCVHSDLLHCGWHLRKGTRVRGLREPVKQFKQLNGRMSITVRFIPRKHRNDIYRWCHNKARDRLGLKTDSDFPTLCEAVSTGATPREVTHED